MGLTRMKYSIHGRIFLVIHHLYQGFVYENGKALRKSPIFLPDQPFSGTVPHMTYSFVVLDGGESGDG